jgi:predicted amidohydrolase
VSTPVKVAAAQYPVEFLGDWQRLEDKLAGMVAEAAAAGAQLLVFPEYGSMELASLYPPEVYRDLRGQIERMQELLGRYLDLHRSLATRHALYLVASSYPVRVDGEFRNRAYVFGPNGGVGFQEKLVMTRFENERWLIKPGRVARVFETSFGRIGVNVCYDVEFPLIARRQSEAGVDLIVVPSCTDTLAGYYRVRVGCQARALENQCFVVQAPTVGEASWSPAVDVNIGAAAAFAPPDRGLPDDGVVARGEMNLPGWVYADLDLEAIRRVRTEGQVLNSRDWSRQALALSGAVETVSL